MTKDQLSKIYPFAGKRIDVFLMPILSAMNEFKINTKQREAAFLAQIGHESGQLLYVKELASGAEYEGRADLGNTMPGDGVQFKGRGLIQITGRTNYVAAMMELHMDCVEHPELLEEPVNAARSAGWFWFTHGLNELADVGDFIKITRKINGGTNGLENRQQLYAKALEIL